MSEESPLVIAIQRVKDKFKRPGSLENIDEIIKETKRQNMILKNQISNLSSEIVLQIRKAMIQLEESNQCMGDIKKGVSFVNDRCKESTTLIKDYQNIKHISYTRNNVEKTYSSLRIFRDLEDRYRILHLVFEKEWDSLKKILPKNVDFDIPPKYDLENKKAKVEVEDDDDEYARSDDEEESKRKQKNFDVGDMCMLDILEQLDNFRKLKIGAKLELRKNHSKQLDIILKNLKTASILEVDFEHLFRKYTRHILDYCVRSPDIIHLLVECIDWQERQDRLNERELKKNARKVKLMDMFFNEMKRSIEDNFDFKEGKMSGVGDLERPLEEQLQAIEQLVTDLQYMEEHVGSKFPRKYKVTEFYIRTSYVSTIVWLKLKTTQQNNEEMNEHEIGNNDKLRMFQWIKETYPRLFQPYKEKNYVKIESLNGLLESLTDSYIRASSKILIECTQRLIRDIFKPDMRPLQVDDESPIYSPGPKELFDMIALFMQQVVEFKLGDILGRVLLNVQDMILNYAYGVVDEIKILDKVEDVAVARFIPYINDFSNLILYLRQKREEIVDTGILEFPKDDKWINWMDRKLPDILEKFAEDCLKIMKKKLFKKMNVYMRELFGSDWAGGDDNNNVAAAVVAHMDNFLNDLEDIEEDYREDFQLQEYCVREYIRRLYFSGRKFGKKEILIVRDDIELFKEELDSRTHFKALDLVRKMMTEDDDEKYNILLGSVMKKFPDFPKKMVAELIRKSSAIKKKQKIMSVVEAYFPEGEGRRGMKDTLFTRINLNQHPDKDTFN